MKNRRYYSSLPENEIPVLSFDHESVAIRAVLCAFVVVLAATAQLGAIETARVVEVEGDTQLVEGDTQLGSCRCGS